ncbi:MAG: ATP-binding protein [Myxococcota bacterium]
MTPQAVDPRSSLFFPERGTRDFGVGRTRWLIQMRWGAMSGALLAALLAYQGFFPGVAAHVMLTIAVVGFVFNFVLWRAFRSGLMAVGPRAGVAQALVDLLLLTLLLWAAGGVESPFLGFYVFHVALIAILGGPRWTFVAVAFCLFGAAFLALPLFVPEMRIGVWNPVPPFDVLSEVAAFVATVIGAGYIVVHAARELRDREKALAAARDRAALEYQLLSNTLDELEAGLEVVDGDGTVLWRNRRAEALAPASRVGEGWECAGASRACERDASGVCPMHGARDGGESGRCRFAASVAGQERVYEMLVFPIDEASPPRVMNLYVDRTSATLAERQLVLAERLASLGRVAQGVAHELNTPLATIRTLAADMLQALSTLRAEDELTQDLGESAALIRDETRRLGRITQSLLAGGDLVRARIDDGVPLTAVVERARAIVVAGVRDEERKIEVDESLDALEVAGDRDRLVQILVNLFQNGLDAMRPTGGALRAHGESDGASVRLIVDDEGPGLPEAMLSRLFEPFATTKPPGEGTGLGLYTSYMLAQAMEGSLTLENREEGGARAVVTLPARAIRLPLAGRAPASRVSEVVG